MKDSIKFKVKSYKVIKSIKFKVIKFIKSMKLGCDYFMNFQLSTLDSIGGGF